MKYFAAASILAMSLLPNTVSASTVKEIGVTFTSKIIFRDTDCDNGGESVDWCNGDDQVSAFDSYYSDLDTGDKSTGKLSFTFNAPLRRPGSALSTSFSCGDMFGRTCDWFDGGAGEGLSILQDGTKKSSFGQAPSWEFEFKGGKGSARFYEELGAAGTHTTFFDLKRVEAIGLTTVPLPETLPLLGLTIFGLGCLGRREATKKTQTPV